MREGGVMKQLMDHERLPPDQACLEEGGIAVRQHLV